MAGDHELTVTLEHLPGLEFKVKFDWPDAAEVLMDEPDPIAVDVLDRDGGVLFASAE
jgi:hypothetical protein